MIRVGACAVLAAALLPLSATAAMATPEALTLTEAVQAALTSSPTLQAAAAKQDVAAARIAEVDSRTRPTVSVGLTPIHLGLTNPALSALLNQMAPGFSPNLISETLTVSQVLYDGGRSKLGEDAAAIGRDMADQAMRLARQNVAFDAANAFIGELRAQALLQALLAEQSQAARHLKDAQDREKTGAGSHFDTLQARTALSDVDGRMIQARNTEKIAQLALATAMHEPLGDRPLDPLVVLPAVEAGGDAVARGIDQRPEVVSADLRSQLDRLNVEITGRQRLPVAGVQVIAASQKVSPIGYAVLGSLSWSLYDGGKADAQTVEARKTASADEADQKALVEGLNLEVEKALADRDDSRERLVMAEQELTTAQAGYELANLRYSQGAGSGTDVIDAGGALTKARLAYTQASYDEITANLRLANDLGIDLGSMLSRSKDH